MSGIIELSLAYQQEIMQVIYTEYHIPLRPISLSNIRGVRFFPMYFNRYDGWFADVNYVDHVETWFIVSLSDGWHDDEWHVERIS